MARNNDVRRRIALLVVLAGLATGGTAHAQPDAIEIMNRVQDLYRGESSHGEITMEIVTEHWSRSITMEMWSYGEDYTLARILAPAREEGTATLRADDDIWNYLPRVDRTIKVPASMMGGSWMGSHFTNDDLVQESRFVEDYDVAITFDGEREGMRVWEITLTPKPEAAVVWGRVEYTVRQADVLPVSVLYYDEDGEVARSMEFQQFERIGGRTMPRLMDMRPADKPEERTTMRYDDIEYDIGIDESFFSLRTLQSRRR